MKLATLRTADKGTTAALLTEDETYLLLPAPDVGALLALPSWRTLVEIATAGGDTPSVPASSVQFARLLPRAGKVVCCGLNYREHIQEMKREIPTHPTLFAKFADTLAGPHDAIEVYGSEKVDWEAELAVVVGSSLTRADESTARGAIAGYTVSNDVSMRDWQNRTLQWFQGKAFDATTPVGPVMLVANQADTQADAHFEVRGFVNGELVQSGNTATLVFNPAQLLSYISHFTTLRPGDLVLTGTPGGVGVSRNPPSYLKDGDLLVTEIEGIGRLENLIRVHPPLRPST
jgi:acylpyruvate hydrolase